jgi:hypothetical protein
MRAQPPKKHDISLNEALAIHVWRKETKRNAALLESIHLTSPVVATERVGNLWPARFFVFC